MKTQTCNAQCVHGSHVVHGSPVMHSCTADYAMAYNIMKFIGISTAIASLHFLVQPVQYSSAFLIGWAYFRVINDPLQQLVMKKGVGVFSRDYGTYIWQTHYC